MPFSHSSNSLASTLQGGINEILENASILTSLMLRCSQWQSSSREVVMPAVVDKCMGSSRQSTKQKAIALAVDYVEVENGGDGVIVSERQPELQVAPESDVKPMVSFYDFPNF